MIPTLRTRNLVLGPFQPDDAAAVQSLAGSRAVARSTLNIPHPYPDGAAEAWIARHPLSFLRGEGVVFALRQAGALVGCVGLTVTEAHQRAELGYWIGEPWWGRGFATEAASACVRFGFQHFGLHRICSHHFAENPASGRVMQKIGMRGEGTLRHHVWKDGRPQDVVQYGILRHELPDFEDSALKPGDEPDRTLA